MKKCCYGIDTFLQKKELKGLRLGLVTNDAVMSSKFIPTRKALINNNFNLVQLFSPEHGIAAMGADGAVIHHQKDILTNLPIFSLYGEHLKPSSSHLTNLDALLFDLPDIGVRFYTYIWTLSYVMEACNEAKLPLYILDRPNPISGRLNLIEAPILEENLYASFIGRWAMPIRHSLTIGELASYWKHERQLNHLELIVVPCESWTRNDFFQDLELPFIPTSPAISSSDTLLTYPALCFLEGLNVSEGRGTAFPFQICGAPFIDGLALSNHFNDFAIEGCKTRPFSFIPSEGRYAQKLCHGIMLHVTNKEEFRPVSTGLQLVNLLFQLYPTEISWATYPTNVNKTGNDHFDLLLGIDTFSKAINFKKAMGKEEIQTLTIDREWAQKVTPFLLY